MELVRDPSADQGDRDPRLTELVLRLDVEQRIHAVLEEPARDVLDDGGADPREDVVGGTVDRAQHEQDVVADLEETVLHRARDREQRGLARDGGDLLGVEALA